MYFLSVLPVAGSTESEDERDKLEVYESLRTHRDLIHLDSSSSSEESGSSNLLRLRSRHKNIAVSHLKVDKDENSAESKGIKGHALSEETMRIAVPAINLSIYVNPVFAHLSNYSLAAACLATSHSQNYTKGFYFNFINILPINY